jgi:CMP-N-acetylneuraminic acid synthetase
MYYIGEGGRVDATIIDPVFEWLPRQRLPKVYIREGSIYLTKKEILMEKNSIRGEDCRAWVVDSNRTCSIDTKLDLVQCEKILKGLSKKIPIGE